MSGGYLGWDIGGAHLKVARLDAAGAIRDVRQVACPLWRGIDELSRACALLGFALDEPGLVHAVTMTGELCDAFADRASGVRSILEALRQVVGEAARIRVFGGYEGWFDPEHAAAGGALAVASSNWLALAAYAAESISDGVLVDVGSTTTDVIPIAAGEVRASGRDDAERLALSELVYTGVVRTPLYAVCDALPFRGRRQPLCAELFATTADVYRLTGDIDARHDLMPAADGGSKDLPGSARRLARMLGRDFAADELEEWRAVAGVAAECQRRRIEDAIALAAGRLGAAGAGAPLIAAGAGAFLVAAIAARRGVPCERFETLAGAGPELAEAVAIAAPAVATAKLAWMTA